MKKKTILLASDHAGFYQKEKIKKILSSLNYNFKDMGALQYNALDDYPDLISKAAHMISKKPKDYAGIILGGSGQGEAMVANRYPHVRATVYYGGSREIIKLSKKHNNANVLSIGARFVKDEDLSDIIREWLETDFSEDVRHIRRIKKIDKYNFVSRCIICIKHIITRQKN